jgi:hypothetical protein
MLCLDLRGLTGTIGAKPLWRIVGEIYHKIVTKKYNEIEGYLPQFKSELIQLSESIEQYLTMQEDLL